MIFGGCKQFHCFLKQLQEQSGILIFKNLISQLCKWCFTIQIRRDRPLTSSCQKLSSLVHLYYEEYVNVDQIRMESDNESYQREKCLSPFLSMFWQFKGFFTFIFVISKSFALNFGHIISRKIKMLLPALGDVYLENQNLCLVLKQPYDVGSS